MKESISKHVAYIRRGNILLGYFPQGADKALMIAVFFILVLGDVVFGTVLGFSIMFGYYIMCDRVGKWDYEVGTYSTQAQIEFQNNPEWIKRWDNMEIKINHLFNQIQYLYDKLLGHIQNSNRKDNNDMEYL